MENSILKGPHISEKSSQRTSSGKYVFKVDRQANKNQIAQAVEKTYGVKVKKVSTSLIKGKKKRITGPKRLIKKFPDWKKAVVQLVKDQKIEVLEG